MKTALLRKIHNWATVFVAVPLLIITVTGIMLMFKKQSSWIQPPTVNGTEAAPTVFFETMLDSVKAASGSAVSSWKEIDRIDVRPNKGVAKVQLKNGIEVQVDLSTGKVLQSAYRRSDLIEMIHTGEYFGEWVKYGVFLTASLVFFVQLATGMILFLRLFSAKMKRRKLIAEEVLSVE